MKELIINCTYDSTLEFSELTDFQGKLKHRDMSDVNKIIKSLEKYGFSFPFFVWKNENKNYVLDGHGRLLALKQLEKDGVKIPKLPVVYVNCKDEKDAKDLLLRLNSSYGKMSKKSVLDFIGANVYLDLDNFELPSFTLDLKSPLEQIDDAYKEALAKRDYVSPTTHATDPVIEIKLENEPTESIDFHNANIEVELDKPEERDNNSNCSKTGEIYYLNDTAIMCGDKNNKIHTEKLLNCTQKYKVMESSPLYVDVIRKVYTKYCKMNNLPLPKDGLK